MNHRLQNLNGCYGGEEILKQRLACSKRPSNEGIERKTLHFLMGAFDIDAQGVE